MKRTAGHAGAPSTASELTPALLARALSCGRSLSVLDGVLADEIGQRMLELLALAAGQREGGVDVWHRDHGAC